MSRAVRITLSVAAAVVVGPLLVAAALFWLVDPQVYKARLEAVASRALGLELSVGGRPGIDLFPGLLLTLEDVSLRRQGVLVATVQRVTVGVELM